MAEMEGALCGLYSLATGTPTLKSLPGSGFVDTKSTA